MIQKITHIFKKTQAPSLGNIFYRLGSKISGFIGKKFTVMLIPHSEQNIINFQINNLMLCFILLLLAGIISGFFYMTTVYVSSDRIIEEQQDDLLVSQGNLDSVLNEVGDLVRVYSAFEHTLRSTLDSLNLSEEEQSSTSISGDLASIRDIYEVNQDEVREIYDLRRLNSSFQESIQPLDDIAKLVESEKQLLTDLPSLWPVAGGYSAVTMEFGPNIHPIEGRWYLHKGIDIAGPIGTPILAAANGRVIESSYNIASGYGNHVLIEHKYGFKTRYSHLSSRLVQVGEFVSQGDRIGTLGNTGVSSGAHLDFQIMLGTEVLDPSSFLSIKNTFTRWTGNR